MICVIPARAGSTRLPGKNTKPFFGQPIINHAIDICQNAEIFSEVVLSTDSMDIARCVDIDYDIRPDHLRGDVSETDVLIDFMERRDVTEICRVYPFSVLLTPWRLICGATFFEENGGTVMEFTKFKQPILRAIKENGDYFDYQSVMERSQDLPEFYHDAATYMVTTIEELKKPLYERKITWLEVSSLECQDVDDAEDWEMLKMKFARLHA